MKHSHNPSNLRPRHKTCECYLQPQRYCGSIQELGNVKMHMKILQEINSCLGASDMSFFYLTKQSQITFQSACTNLYSHKDYGSVLTAPHSC